LGALVGAVEATCWGTGVDDGVGTLTGAGVGVEPVGGTVPVARDG